MLQVLIIDDTKAIHSFVKNFLSKSSDIVVTSAFNGQEGVDFLKQNIKIDLVFLDWEMPVLNGPETMVAIKKLGLQVPVIMMTTKNKAEDIEQMLRLGVSEYLMKPFTIDILFEKIELATGKAFSYAG